MSHSLLRATLVISTDRVKKCKFDKCGKLFSAERPNQLYCSTKCSDAHRAAKYRKRKRGDTNVHSTV